MNAIRPSDPKVPTLSAAAQYYVYSADNNHVGPVTADLIARGVASGKVPNDAFIAPLGSNTWTPMAQISEVADAVRVAKTQSTPPPPLPAPRDLSPSSSAIPAPILSPLPVPPAFTQLSPLAPAPASTSFPATVPATQPASASMPAAAPATLAAAPAPAAAAPAAAKPAAAAAPAADKKPVLDPRFKLLPVAIFGVFAFLGILETAVVLIFR